MKQVILTIISAIAIFISGMYLGYNKATLEYWELAKFKANQPQDKLYK